VRWTAVVNPGAGRRRTTRDLDRLTDALARRAVEICVTASADEGRAVARAAFVRGEGVLACGGDGTVRQVAEVASTVDGLLAVVPLGAGNDFARALGLDHARPADALALLDDGFETRVDLGRARTADGCDVAFTTVAHSGLDGEVNRWANEVTWVSGTALYALAALRTMARYHPTAMRITTDDTVWEGDTWMVSIANTPCYGGGMRIAPTAQLDDGRLEVIVIAGLSRGSVVADFPRMIRGTHLGIDGVHHFSGRTVTVEGASAQDLYASGECIGALPATVTVDPGALRVVVPCDSPAQRVSR
jgi:YegS/Rv2252/BmrU family lipid kinase